MKTLNIRKSIQSDILPIAHNMRDMDVKEIWDSHRSSPYNALRRGLKTKGNTWTIIVNGIPVGMVGVVERTLLSDTGTPWLLGTDVLTDDTKLFLKISKIVLKKMSQGYKMLENYESVENTASLRWLKKLGFTIGEEIKGITGVSFRRFYMKLEDKQ